MKSNKLFFVLVTWVLLGSAAAFSATQILVRAKADRVNLRAKSDLNSEVVGQMAEGETLAVKSIEGDWIFVESPERVDFWIHKDFVENDAIIVNKLNARSGPGINYNVVGSFVKGDRINRRGTFGEWIKIAPTADGGLWVSTNFIEVVYPAPTLPPPVAAPKMTAPSARPPPPAAPAEAPVVKPTDPAPATLASGRAAPLPVTAVPSDLELVPLDGQGRVVKREGELKRAAFFLFKSPGTHRLIEREGNRITTKAYVRGNSEQLNALVGQRLVIQGREYWVEGSKIPVIVIESIEKRSL